MKKLFLSNKNMPEEKMEKDVFPGFYVLNPHIPFYLYTPISIGMLLLAVFYAHLLWWQILIGIGASFIFWPVFEYCMHRYLFHWESTTAFGKKFVYTVHRGHHDYPNDPRLMLVGPIISLPAFLAFWGIAYLLAGNYAHPFMAGLGVCYMFYDWLHYASHNYNFNNSFFQTMKTHHMRHHYENNEKNFAFTTLFWDIIMNTLLRKKKNK